MYLNEFNLMQGQQLPYPNRPATGIPFTLGGQFPYPGFIPGDPFAPMGQAFQLSAAPNFTDTSPIIPASMMTPVTACGEGVAPALYPNQLGSTTTAYLAADAVTVPGGVETSRGDVRNVLEPILLADLLLGL